MTFENQTLHTNQTTNLFITVEAFDNDGTIYFGNGTTEKMSWKLRTNNDTGK